MAATARKPAAVPGASSARPVQPIGYRDPVAARRSGRGPLEARQSGHRAPVAPELMALQRAAGPGGRRRPEHRERVLARRSDHRVRPAAACVRPPVGHLPAAVAASGQALRQLAVWRLAAGPDVPAGPPVLRLAAAPERLSVQEASQPERRGPEPLVLVLVGRLPALPAGAVEFEAARRVRTDARLRAEARRAPVRRAQNPASAHWGAPPAASVLLVGLPVAAAVRSDAPVRSDALPQAVPVGPRAVCVAERALPEALGERQVALEVASVAPVRREVQLQAARRVVLRADPAASVPARAGLDAAAPWIFPRVALRPARPAPIAAWPWMMRVTARAPAETPAAPWSMRW